MGWSGTHRLVSASRSGVALLLWVLCSVGCSTEYSGEAAPRVNDGILDLAGWDFQRDGPVPLDGNWRFHWGKSIKPAPWETIKTEFTESHSMPSDWDKHPSATRPDSNLPSIGVATYALEVVNFSGPFPALSIDGVANSADVAFIQLDGTIISQDRLGVVGMMPSEVVPVPHGQIGVPAPSIDGSRSHPSFGSRWVILMSVSNFHDTSGGIWNTPTLLPHEASVRNEQQRLFRANFMFGVLCIIGLYHLILFAQRRDDKSALLFGGFCLSIAARTFAMSIGQSLGLTTSQGVYEFLQTIEYLSMPLMVMSSTFFIHALVPGERFRVVLKVWSFGFGLLLVALPLATSKAVFGEWLPVYQVQILGALLVVLGHLFVATFQGDRLAQWCLAAFGLIAAGATNDILHSNSVIETTHIVPFTTIGFVLTQAGILAARNAAIAAERDALNATKLEVLRKSEEAARVKSEFLANMSHELRTPLNALCNIPKALMANFAELMVWECPECEGYFEDDTPPHQREAALPCPDCEGVSMKLIKVLRYVGDHTEQHHYMKRIDRQAHDLLGLVERVLSFNEVTSKERQSLSIAPVSTKDLFLPLLDEFRSRAFQRSQVLAVEFETTSDVVRIDVEKVEQCLDLVLDNALKFSLDQGYISCTIQVTSQSSLVITVSDDGIGIPKAELNRIFTPFYQVESSHTREFGGAGLGLSLAKELAEVHHGTITVESIPGAGSTFVLEFCEHAAMDQES